MIARDRSAPVHMVRYGIHREAHYFCGEFADSYDWVVFNGAMVADAASGLAAFASSKATGKPFIIDPQTHAFQHGLASVESSKTGGIKRSILKLADYLGEPVKSRLSSWRPVTPEDFSGSLVEAFVARVADFQLNTLRTQAAARGELEYYQFAGIAAPLEPESVVAPYFLMDETTVDDWLPLNVRFVECSKQLHPGRSVTLQLVVDQGLLLSDQINNVIDLVVSSRADQVAVWVDRLDEVQAPAFVLKKYLGLLKAIGKSKPVSVLYGSYLPVILAKVRPGYNIAGVCHGLEYGEHRPVVPVGGGIPISKFYYPRVHARLDYFDAYKLASRHLGSASDYMANVCDCPVCTELIGGATRPDEGFALYGEPKSIRVETRHRGVSYRNIPTPEARDRCVRHYLHVKSREFREPRREPAVVSKELRDAREEAMALLGSSAVGHLKVWADLIEKEGDGF